MSERGVFLSTPILKNLGGIQSKSAAFKNLKTRKKYEGRINY